jgi:hypothetical protein
MPIKLVPILTALADSCCLNQVCHPFSASYSLLPARFIHRTNRLKHCGAFQGTTVQANETDIIKKRRGKEPAFPAAIAR